MNEQHSARPSNTMSLDEAIRRIGLKMEVRKRDPWSAGMVMWAEIGEIQTLLDWIADRRAPETPAALTSIEQLLVEWWGSEMDNAELFNRAVRLSPALADAMQRLPEKACEHDWRDHPTFKDWQSCSRCTLFRRAAVNGNPQA